MIRSLAAGEDGRCEEILRALPDWFGIEDALVQYVRDVTAMDTRVDEREGAIQGFLTLNRHNPFTAEIHVIAVAPGSHRRGIGRALVEDARARLHNEGVEFLQVKTLGPSRPDAHYEGTRVFYERLGFRPLEENRLWGDVNPCLILVQHLSCGT